MKIHIKAIALTICLFYTISAAFAIEQMSIEKNAILNIKDCITIALQNSPKIKKHVIITELQKGI